MKNEKIKKDKTLKNKTIEKDNKKKSEEKRKKFSFFEEMKNHEKIGTIVLAFFFLVIFIYLSYHFFSIDSEIILQNFEKVSDFDSSVSLSYNSIILTNKDVLTDDKGLQTKPYPLVIKNNTGKTQSYEILLSSQEDLEKRCGCMNSFDFSSIRYSLDQKNVSSPSNEKTILAEGEIGSMEAKTILVQLWINEDKDYPNDSHFHGHFLLNTK